MEEFFEHRVEVLALCAGIGAGDVFPYAESWPNSVICPAKALIRISHLLYDSDLLHEEPGALPGESGSCSRDGKILTGAAAADDVHGRE